MAKFKGAVKVCQHCGKEYKVPPCRAKSANYCSKECADNYRGATVKKPKIRLICDNCKCTFERHESQSIGAKYCSYNCRYTHDKFIESMREQSCGSKNGMWKGGLVAHTDGYVYEHTVNHPFSCNNYVLQHRLVIERFLLKNMPYSLYLVEIGESMYLSPDCVVHHIDRNRSNNSIDNLQVMSNSEHSKLHNAARRKEAK